MVYLVLTGRKNHTGPQPCGVEKTKLEKTEQSWPVLGITRGKKKDRSSITQCCKWQSSMQGCKIPSIDVLGAISCVGTYILLYTVGKQELELNSYCHLTDAPQLAFLRYLTGNRADLD